MNFQSQHVILSPKHTTTSKTNISASIYRIFTISSSRTSYVTGNSISNHCACSPGISLFYIQLKANRYSDPIIIRDLVKSRSGFGFYAICLPHYARAKVAQGFVSAITRTNLFCTFIILLEQRHIEKILIKYNLNA